VCAGRAAARLTGVRYRGSAAGPSGSARSAPARTTLRATATIRRPRPAETIGRVVAFFEARGRSTRRIGSFGPSTRAGRRLGHITTTPKPGWATPDVARRSGAARRAGRLRHRRQRSRARRGQRTGAARGLETFCYVTVGNRDRRRRMVGGRLLHGLHPPGVRAHADPARREADRFPASARTTGTAGRGSRPAARSRPGGGGPGRSSSRGRGLGARGAVISRSASSA
jgi:fructokinase